MNADPERYRFATVSLHGVATVAILCATCHEADEQGEPVKVFDHLYPSLADVHTAVDAHEVSRHGGEA